MAGVNIFINKIENNTPSGKLAFQRINKVNVAAPIANTYLPAGLTGEVTGSVNMNTAPKTTPPPSTLTIANLMALP